jgi:hypothetical protein
MRRRNVALYGMSSKLSELIHELVADDDGLAVIAELHDLAELPGVLTRTRVDVLLVGDVPDDPEARFEDLLAPALPERVVVLANGARDAAIHELRPHRTTVTDVSPDSLLGALRGGA